MSLQGHMEIVGGAKYLKVYCDDYEINTYLVCLKFCLVSCQCSLLLLWQIRMVPSIASAMALERNLKRKIALASGSNPIRQDPLLPGARSELFNPSAVFLSKHAVLLQMSCSSALQRYTSKAMHL